MSRAAGYSSSYFRQRIEGHFEALDLDIVCRKRKHSYTLYRAADGAQWARIQRVGPGNQVRLSWWDDGSWQPVAEHGTAISLDKALEYITDDPDDRFVLGEVSEDRDGELLEEELNRVSPGVVLALQSNLAAWAMLCGALSGLAAGPKLGLLYAVLIPLAGYPAYEFIHYRSKRSVVRGFVTGLPIALLVVPAAIIGGSVHGAWTDGPTRFVVGALAGAFSALLTLQRPWCAWLVAATAGIIVAQWLADLVHLREHFVGLLVIVVVASNIARVYSNWIGLYLRTRTLLQSVMERELSR